LLALASLVLAITLASLNHPSPASETAVSGYGTVIGIDLGTTYTRVSVYKNDTVHVLVNDQDERSTPSWVRAPSDTISWVAYAYDGGAFRRGTSGGTDGWVSSGPNKPLSRVPFHHPLAPSNTLVSKSIPRPRLSQKLAYKLIELY
jgi:Hsp70 protein